jgi:hypothetical protein
MFAPEFTSIRDLNALAKNKVKETPTLHQYTNIHFTGINCRQHFSIHVQLSNSYPVTPDNALLPHHAPPLGHRPAHENSRRPHSSWPQQTNEDRLPACFLRCCRYDYEGQGIGGCGGGGGEIDKKSNQGQQETRPRLLCREEGTKVVC